VNPRRPPSPFTEETAHVRDLRPGVRRWSHRAAERGVRGMFRRCCVAAAAGKRALP